jgi:hypothetical protein
MPADDSRTAELQRQIQADANKLTELAAAWAEDEITGPEWRAARERIEARLTANRRAVDTARGHRGLRDLAGQGSVLADQWDDLPLSRQAAIVKTILDHVVIHPAPRRGPFKIDPARVEPIWKA